MTSNKINTDNIVLDSFNYDNNLNNVSQNRTESNWSKWIRRIIYANIIFKFCFYIIFIFSFIILCLMISSLKDKTNESETFESIPASRFSDVEYFGKDDLLKKIVTDMAKITELTEYNCKNVSKKKISDTKRNYLFYGPPGTGKTHFVKKLAYTLNEKLKKDLKIANDCVRVFMVSSSMLESKWLGESEKNIHRLFSEARNNKNWKATFIFLDEIESFFGKRELYTSEDRFRVKAEFLNLMNGTLAAPDKNVFFIGATNLNSRLDDAFSRRLSNQYKFDYPDVLEIRHIIESKTQKWDNSKKKHLDAIIKQIEEKKLAQSKIVEIIDNVEFSNDKNNKDIFEKLLEEVSLIPDYQTKENNYNAELLKNLYKYNS